MDKYTIRNASGSVDIDASTAAFRAALTAQVAGAEALATKIEAAIEAVFDEQGARLPKGMLIDGALAKLGATSETHTSLTHSVEEYLRANTSKDKGADGRRIAAIKGQKGGLQRLAEPGQPVTALPAKA
jgi:hypothetical protein